MNEDTGTPAPAPAAEGAAGQQTPAAGDVPADAAKAAQAGLQRGPDGKFAPKPGAAAGDPAKPKEVQAERARRIAIKAYGQGREFDLERDEDLEQLRVLAELGAGGKRRFTELDARAKELQQLEQRLIGNPWDVLREKGKDPLKEAEALIAKHLEDLAMSPDARGRREEEQRRQKTEAERDDLKQQLEDREVAAHEERTAEMFSIEVPKALESVGLPGSAEAFERMKSFLKAVDAAGERITPETISASAKLARQEMGENLRGLATGLKGRQLVDFLGQAVADELRRYDLEQYETKRSAAAAAPPPRDQLDRAGQKPKQEKHFVSLAEIRRISRDGQ